MIELTCETCGATVLRYPSHIKARVFCSDCGGRGRPRKEKPTTRRNLVVGPDHPLSAGGKYVAEQRVVLYEKVGPGPHTCHWCGKPVRWVPGARTASGALVADHVNGDPLDNRPENLVPACQGCNTWRDRPDLIRDGEPFVSVTGIKGVTRTRAIERTCEFCGQTFLTRPSQVAAGRGRFCSRSCARRHQHSR